MWWLWCSLSIAVCGELQNCHLVISASVTTPTHPRPPKIILFVFCFLGPIFTVILSLLLFGAIFMLLLVLVTNHFPDLHPNHDLHVYSISCFYCVFWTQPKLAVLMLRRIWGLVLLLGLHYCCLTVMAPQPQRWTTITLHRHNICRRAINWITELERFRLKAHCSIYWVIFYQISPPCQILDTWRLQHSSNSKEMQTLTNQFQNWQDPISKLVKTLTRFAFSNYMRLAPQSIVFLFSFAFSYLHIPKYSPKKIPLASRCSPSSSKTGFFSLLFPQYFIWAALARCFLSTDSSPALLHFAFDCNSTAYCEIFLSNKSIVSGFEIAIAIFAVIQRNWTVILISLHCTIIVSVCIFKFQWWCIALCSSAWTSQCWTQVCSGDLEADPPGPAFYNRPTIAADIFTTLLLLNYTSLSFSRLLHPPTSLQESCPEDWRPLSAVYLQTTVP